MNKEGLKHIGIETGKSVLYLCGMAGLWIAPYSYTEMTTSIKDIRRDLGEFQKEEAKTSTDQKPITLKEKSELLIVSRKVYSLGSSLTDGMISENQSQLISDAYKEYEHGRLYENVTYGFGFAVAASFFVAITDYASELNENYYDNLVTPLKFPPNTK